jgi:hypothetical protein
LPARIASWPLLLGAPLFLFYFSSVFNLLRRGGAVCG